VLQLVNDPESPLPALTPPTPPPAPKSEIAIVTICQKKTLSGESGTYLPDHSLKEKRAYCAKHGYAFYGYTEHMVTKVPGRKKEHAAWFKLVAMRLKLDEHKWVLWLDCDTVFADIDFKIEDLIRKHQGKGIEMIATREKFSNSPRTAWTDKYKKKIYGGKAAGITEGQEVYLRFVINTGKKIEPSTSLNDLRIPVPSSFSQGCFYSSRGHGRRSFSSSLLDPSMISAWMIGGPLAVSRGT
jgi:hypothetical protein